MCAFTALPFLRFLVNNLDQTIQLERLALWWAAITLPPVVLLIRLRRHRPQLFPRSVVLIALGFYAFFELAKPLSDTLGLSGFTQVGLLTIGLLAFVVVASRWNWVRAFLSPFALLSLVAMISPGLLRSGDALRQFEPEPPWAIEAIETPDIYWFVLDGYGRLDTLSDLGVSGVDAFADHLEQRGFSIADEARGNLPLTHLSIASTLTANWLVDQDTTITDQSPFFSRMQGANTVVRTLRVLGYQFALWPGDRYPGTACSGYEDICLRRSAFGNIEWGLLEMTPVSELITENTMVPTFASRSDPVRAAHAILSIRDSHRVFAFIHLMSPHPPYNGAGPACSAQPDDWNWKDTARYVRAVECLNPRILEATDLIVNEAPNAIVILQSDHGPATGLNLFDGSLGEVSESQITRSLSVFSAMRLPRGCEQPPDLSLINTFRIVFGCMSSDDIPLLDYRSWIANHEPGQIMELENIGP